MESSLLGRNVHIARGDAPAARLPLHGRRQLRDRDPVRIARHRRRRDARPARGRRRGRACGQDAVGVDLAGAADADSTSPTSAHAARRCAERRARRRRQLRGVHRRRRRRGRRGRARSRVNGDGAGQRRARRGRRPARASSTSPPTTSSTARTAGPYVESDPTAPLARLRAHEARRRAARSPAANPTTRSSRTAWLFGAGGKNFVDTMLRARRRARRGQRRHRPGRLPDVDGPPRRRRCVDLAERRRDRRLPHAPAAGRCSWHELAVEIFDRAGVDCRVRRRPASAEFPRPAPRPACSVLGTERDERAAPAPVAGRRCAGLPRRAEGPHEAARLRRGRVHRLELRPPARPRPRRRGRRARQADLRRAAREPRGPRRRTLRRTARSRTPTPSPRRSATASTRSSTSPPRRTSTARSPSPTRSSRPTRAAPTSCSRPRASAGCATCRSRPTRSTARSRRARSPRSRRCSPSSPYSATKAGADLLVASYFHTYGLETRHLPRLEQLRARTSTPRSSSR